MVLYGYRTPFRQSLCKALSLQLPDDNEWTISTSYNVHPSDKRYKISPTPEPLDPRYIYSALWGNRLSFAKEDCLMLIRGKRPQPRLAS